MQRERVSENVYWFQSEVYAQVTAGLITGPQWAVVIDTLALPEEALTIRTFVEEDLGIPIRYVINTHYHADHSWGNYCFPGATLIAHADCRTLMTERSVPAMDVARKQNPAFKQAKIVLPQITFSDGDLSLRVGKKNLILIPTPGHSSDGISILVEEDRILFAGDAFLPVPYFVDGNIDDIAASIKKIGKMGLENIVQGHGDIILRGEIDEAVKENLAYLNNVKRSVRQALKRRNPLEFLEGIDIESCGKNRIYLGGLAADLHKRNLRFLHKQLSSESVEPLPGEGQDL